MIRFLHIAIFLIFLQASAQKSYYKDSYENGKPKSEGWISQDIKIDYWFFYYENGNKKEEGHYINNKKTKWWIFYNTEEQIIKKCEFFNDKMNGYCIIYKDGEIIRVEKYKMGKKIKSWDSVSEFKKENPLLSYLQ
jgi:antitoxin component YwqK of YwqJK toxin-antitoxin module